jgi:hypothetical protein
METSIVDLLGRDFRGHSRAGRWAGLRGAVEPITPRRANTGIWAGYRAGRSDRMLLAIGAGR